MCVVQLRDADATRELLTDAQQRTAQLQADLMQARQDAQQASLAYHQERVWPYAPPLSIKALAVNSVISWRWPRSRSQEPFCKRFW